MWAIVLLPILVFSSGVLGRTTDSLTSEASDALLISLLDDLTDAEAAELIPEAVSDLLARPYDLSNPDDRILQLVPTLTELEAIKIRLLRNATTEEEIRRILPENLYNRTRPFLSLSPQPKHLLELRSRTSTDPGATAEKEYVEEKYRGASVRSSNLVRLYSDYINAGFIQSKDAGEPLFLDHVGGYCSLSQPVELSESFSVQRAVVGDYSVGYGEGLMLLRSYARSKSGDAITPLGVNATGIGNYLSTSAYRFYRGAATSLLLDNISVDLFYSNRFVDATVSDTGTITSLSYTGYHRTVSEQDRRLSTRQSVIGGNIGYAIVDEDDARLSVSATGYYLAYDGDVVSSDSLKTRFIGRDLTAGSLSLVAFFDNYSLRGEVGRSTSDAATESAMTATLLARPWERWEFAANFRLLPEGFISPLGGIFGDNASDVQNETGGYLGVRTTLPGDALTLEGYADISSRLQNTPTNENLLSTRDFRIKASWSKPTAPLHLSFESRYRVREELTAVRSDTIEPHEKVNLKLRPGLNFSDRLHATFHTEFVRYSEPDINDAFGCLGGVTLHYRPFDVLQVGVSTYLYATDTYDSRIYITEPEVPGVGGFTFLYGDGVRYSLLVSTTVFDALQLFGKFSESRFFSPSTNAREVNTYLTFQAELRL